jgi:hypothetical protein
MTWLLVALFIVSAFVVIFFSCAMSSEGTRQEERREDSEARRS